MNRLSNKELLVGTLALSAIAGGTYYLLKSKKNRLPEYVFVTCTSPVNIAVIKYWGKRDVNLNLPLNASLSGTLSQDDMRSTTTIMASRKLKEDEIWLNGKKEDISNERIQRCLEAIRQRANDYKDNSGKILIPKENWSQYRVRIVSVNNFPTAAGLASSASGYCALVYTLSKLYHVEGDVSTIARLGSGSACRSLYGGWVKWVVGELPDGSDSKAIQVKDENHWPEIEVLVCVVNDQKKETSSTEGMQNSVATSQLMKTRATSIVPERMKQMEKAIEEKDFQTFANLTMKDSDNFHDVCADTNPPIYYLRSISKDIIKIINAYNHHAGKFMAAYTFDAGPNAVIYLPRQNISTVLALMFHYFPPNGKDEASFFKNAELLKECRKVSLEGMDSIATGVPVTPHALKYILHTTVGGGPKVLSESESLIDLKTGQPKSFKLN